MAGKRQHYIPQFFQAGFCSRQDVKKSKKHTFVYRYSKSSCDEISIKNVAVGNFFYGDLDNDYIDEKITKVENEVFSPLLRKLLNYPSGTIDRCLCPDIAYFIAHLVIRNSHTRNFISTFQEVIFSEVVEFISSDENLIFFVKRMLRQEKESMLKKIVDNYLAIHGALLTFNEYKKLKTDIENRANILFEVFIHSTTVDEIKSSSGFNHFITVLADLYIERCALSEEVHKRVLSESVSHAKLQDKLSYMAWSLVSYDQPKLILGDVITIGYGPNGFSSLLYNDFIEQDYSIVYFPISSKNLLVGTLGFEDEDFLREVINVDAENLNYALAIFSDEFFIFHKDSESMRKVSTKIRSAIDAHISSLVKTIVSENFQV